MWMFSLRVGKKVNSKGEQLLPLCSLEPGRWRNPATPFGSG